MTAAAPDADWIASHRSLLIVSDFDGTLSELIENPDLAVPSPGAAAALHALSELPGVSVTILSGRPWNFLRERIGLGRLTLIGSHGEEVGIPAVVPAEVDEALREAQRLLAADKSIAECKIERKPLGVGVHYRGLSPLHAAAAHDACAAVAARTGLHVRGGSCVYELCITGDGKAAALRRLIARERADCTLCLGDDEPDEDCFLVLDPARDATVKVGEGPTRARFRLDTVPEVVALLQGIAAARTARH